MAGIDYLERTNSWHYASFPPELIFMAFNMLESGIKLTEVTDMLHVDRIKGKRARQSVMMGSNKGYISNGVIFLNEVVIKAWVEPREKQTQNGPEFYYNTLDGLVLNNGTVLSKNDLVLTFDNLPFSDARYLGFKNGKHHVNFSIKSFEETKANIRATAIHEIYGHGVMGYGNADKTHYMAYFASIDSKYWKATTDAFKTSTVDNMWGYYYKEVGFQRMPEPYQTMYDLYHGK